MDSRRGRNSNRNRDRMMATRAFLFTGAEVEVASQHTEHIRQVAQHTDALISQHSNIPQLEQQPLLGMVALSDSSRFAIQALRALLQFGINISILALLGRFVVDTTEGVNKKDELPTKLIEVTEPVLGPSRKVIPYLFEVDASALAIIAVLTLTNELFIGDRVSMFCF